MGFRIENNCVGPCPMGCIDCGRRHEHVYYCDICDDYADEDNPLYEFEGKEVCENCLLESLMSKICDECDTEKCASCGSEAEELYFWEGSWYCESCILEQFEKAYMEN